MIATINLLLQSTQPAAEGRPPPGPGSFIASPMFLLLLMVGVFWFVMFRGNRKEKQKKQAMLDAVAKNDRVLTIGGIIGTVVQVKGEEVVIKVDESTNTKMTVIRSGIRQILDRDEALADAGK